MNNRKIIFLLTLIVSTFLLSCEDNLYENMVEDKVYIVESGINEVEISSSGSYTYGLYVIKSGVGQQAATVRLEVNQQLLEAYNADNGTNYALLPEQYFNIVNNEISFAKEEYEAPFEITFDVSGILELQMSSEVIYALPYELKVVGSEIAIGGDEGSTSIIIPTVAIPEEENTEV